MNKSILIFILLISIFFVPITKGQRFFKADPFSLRNNFTSGMGITKAYIAPATGYSYFWQYHYYLNRNMSISPEISVMTFNEHENKAVLQMGNGTSTALNMHIFILELNRLFLHVGGGINYSFFNWGISNGSNNDYTFSDMLVPAHQNKLVSYSSLGYSISGGVCLRLNARFQLLFSSVYQSGEKSHRTWEQRLGLSLKF